MRIIHEKRDTVQLLIGIMLAEAGAALVGCGEWNGVYFEAYEEETGHGDKRFRLRSFPPVGPEREAGFIRHLIHEGFIEKRWPRLSEKIKEEAGWAFF